MLPHQHLLPRYDLPGNKVALVIGFNHIVEPGIMGALVKYPDPGLGIA